MYENIFCNIAEKSTTDEISFNFLLTIGPNMQCENSLSDF